MPAASSYHTSASIPQRVAGIALAAAVAASGGGVARAETLAELLGAVATAARFASPARADATIIRSEAASGARRAILVGRGRTLYLEIEGGPRAVLHPGKVVVGDGGRVRRAAVGAAVPGTDLLFEDLYVFSPASLAMPQVSDDGPAGTVVTSAPAGPSAYALLVYTIDPARHAVTKVQYYQRTLNNLVKIRRDALANVGGRWRPATIDVQDLATDTTTRIFLVWRPVPDVPPALFTPVGLHAASGLH